MNRRGAERGTGWVVAQIFLLTVAMVMPVARHVRRPRSASFTRLRFISRVTGSIGLLVSSLVFCSALRALGKDLTPFPVPRPNAVLRRRGIYGIVRHPVYLGLMLGALSWALVWASTLGLAWALPCACFFKLKSRYEERILLVQFPDYAEYQRTVPAFIPRQLARFLEER